MSKKEKRKRKYVKESGMKPVVSTQNAYHKI